MHYCTFCTFGLLSHNWIRLEQSSRASTVIFPSNTNRPQLHFSARSWCFWIHVAIAVSFISKALFTCFLLLIMGNGISSSCRRGSFNCCLDFSRQNIDEPFNVCAETQAEWKNNVASNRLRLLITHSQKKSFKSLGLTFSLLVTEVRFSFILGYLLHLSHWLINSSQYESWA